MLSRSSVESSCSQVVFVLGLHRLQHVRCVLLQNFDQGFSFTVHAFDACHALVGLASHQVDIAHQAQSFEEEYLLLSIPFFLRQHHVAELRRHHLGELESPLLHVPFNLVQGL